MQVVLAHHEGIDSSNLPAAASSSASSNRLIRFTVATAAQLTRMAQEDLQQLEVTKLCLQQGINALSEESVGSFGDDYTKKKQQDSSSRMSSSTSFSSSALFDAIRREGKRAKDEVSRLSQQLMDELSRRRRELHESIDLHVERCCAALDTLRSCAQSVTDVLERVDSIDKGNDDDDRAAMSSSSSLVFNSLHRLVRKVELLSSKEERLVLNAHLALRNTFPVPRDLTTTAEEEEEERQGAVTSRNRSTLLTLPTAHSEEQVRLCPFRLRLNPCFVLSEIRRWDVKCDLPCIAEEANKDNNNVAAVGPIASDHLSSASFRWQSEKEDTRFTNAAAGNESSSNLNYSRFVSQTTMKPTTHHRGWRSHQGLPAKCAYQRHIRTPDPALLLRRLLPHHHNSSSNEHQMT